MKVLVACLGAMLVSAVGVESGAQASPRRCSVPVVDTAIYGVGQFYRDCDVDQPAKLIFVPQPSVKLQHDPICVYTELEFAVGEDGQPLLATARAKRGNSRKFTQLTLSTLPEWRYSPAIKGGVAVRQVVKERLARENERLLTVKVMRPGDRPPPPGPPPPCV